MIFFHWLAIADRAYDSYGLSTLLAILMCVVQLASSGSALAHEGPDLVSVHPWDAMGEERVLPFGRKKLAPELDTIRIRLTPGEWEPHSFVLSAHESVRGVTIAIGGLTSESGAELAAESVKARVVKPWFQDGRRAVRRSKKQVVPELLLHDDSLIRIDRESHENRIRVQQGEYSRYVRISGKTDALPLHAFVRDASRLQPFALQLGEKREIWLTTHVDEGTPPGVYSGSLTLRAEAQHVRNVPIAVEVLPFELEPPSLQYAIYYRGQLIPEGHPGGRTDVIRSEPIVRSARWKTEEQYRRELRDIAEHGLSHPTLYHYAHRDLSEVERALAIRRSEGFDQQELFLLGFSVGKQKEKHELARLRGTILHWLDALGRLGMKTVFFYGIDEAEGEVLLNQASAWRTVREAGGKIFTAIKAGNAEAVGNLLDVAVVAYDLDPDEVAEYHARGARVFSYANPQAGVENPKVYRENYGLRLWKAGYDGCMLYSYQHGLRRSEGDIWNDFDGTTPYREIVFTYPTDGDLVSTVQWEGLREAIDDVRYLSTLRARIQSLPDGDRRRDAELWVGALDVDRPAGIVRSEIIEKIDELLAPAAHVGQVEQEDPS